jgi:hypothetical protein
MDDNMTLQDALGAIADEMGLPADTPLEIEEPDSGSLEQLDMRAIMLMVMYNYEPKHLALVAAGLEVDKKRITDKLAAARAEIEELYKVIHDMDNARLEIRREMENIIVKTGNAYRPAPPK